MAINGVRMQQVAMQLLRENCQQVQYRRNAVAPYDPATGQAIPLASETYTGYGNPTLFKKMDTDGSVVLEANTRLIMATDEAEPLANDIFIVDGKEYTALSVQKVPAGNTVVTYIVELRQ